MNDARKSPKTYRQAHQTAYAVFGNGFHGAFLSCYLNYALPPDALPGVKRFRPNAHRKARLPAVLQIGKLEAVTIRPLESCILGVSSL